MGNWPVFVFSPLCLWLLAPFYLLIHIVIWALSVVCLFLLQQVICCGLYLFLHVFRTRTGTRTLCVAQQPCCLPYQIRQLLIMYSGLHCISRLASGQRQGLDETWRCTSHHGKVCYQAIVADPYVLFWHRNKSLCSDRTESMMAIYLKGHFVAACSSHWTVYVQIRSVKQSLDEKDHSCFVLFVTPVYIHECDSPVLAAMGLIVCTSSRECVLFLHRSYFLLLPPMSLQVWRSLCWLSTGRSHQPIDVC